jgi:hypothetical protein
MEDVKIATITVARVAYWSVGVRLWFVVQATDGTRYQRWSLNMDSSDECLMLAKTGDQLELSYLNQAVDVQGTTQKNVITVAEFK